MSKVIILDWSIYLHRAVYASRNNEKIPPTYTAMNMVLGNLKKVGIKKDDLVIVGCDGRKSWRKEIEHSYKGNRKEKRDSSGLNWDKYFKDFDVLLEEIDISTPWHIIKFDHIECDDIMAMACRYYTSKEIILISYDSDLEQCWEYPNVKIFSQMTKKWKLKPKNFNHTLFIGKKIKKEVADNLISPVLNEEDYDKRMTVVNLLKLPEWVETKIKEKLEQLKEKKYYPNEFPFRYLHDRYHSLYDNEKYIIDYDKQLKKKERAEEIKKEKKAKEKRKKE